MENGLHREHLWLGCTRVFYYWKTIGKIYHDPVDLNLLDTDEYFSGQRKKVNPIYTNDFEQDTSSWICPETLNSDNHKMCLQNRKSRTFEIPFLSDTDSCKWIRAQADFHSIGKEWIYWKMGEMVLRLANVNNDIVKVKMIRINRQLAYQNGKDIYIDVKIPLVVDNLSVECFQ